MSYNIRSNYTIVRPIRRAIISKNTTRIKDFIYNSR